MEEAIQVPKRMKRIAITGPESSGKTSLAELLAEKSGLVYVPEFAREYLMERGGKYQQEDLVQIALGQMKLWSEVNSAGGFVADTEMLVMKIWSDFKYGQTDQTILSLLERQQFDHYFLCYPDIPWEEDPLREHPEQRMELFELYLKELEDRKLPFTILKGDLSERLEACREILE